MRRVLSFLHGPALLPEFRAALVSREGVSVEFATGGCEDARQLLQRGAYDVVLLPLALHGGDVFELVAVVRPGTRVVFLAAKSDWMTGYVQSAGWECWVMPSSTEGIRALLERLDDPAPPRPALVPVKIGAVARLLSMEEIYSVAADGNYTRVNLAHGHRVFVRRSMKQWSAMLPPAQFVRVHRAALVNLNAVARVTRGPGYSLVLHFVGDAAEPLEIKRRYAPFVRDEVARWRAQASSRPPAVAAPLTLAVLPFDYLGPAPAPEVFCAGLAEDLLSTLARFPELRVAARTSAFSFRGRKVPIRRIATQLGVEYLVEGTVRSTAEGLFVSVRLISARDGLHLWSDRLGCPTDSTAATLDLMANGVARALNLPVRPRRDPVTWGTEVHWLVQEGREFWNRRSEDGLNRAEAAFTRAIALAPDCGPAHAGLADVHVIRAMSRLADGLADSSVDLARARAAAERALQCDASLAEAYATLGFTAFHAGHLEAAAETIPRAFAVNPNYSTAYQFHAWTLCALGRLDDAIRTYRTCVALDPLSFINLDRYAVMLTLAGDYAAALGANERAAAFRPDVVVGNVAQRALILLMLGRHEEALAAARQVRDTPPGPYRRNSDADMVYVLRQCGRADEAAMFADALLQRYAPGNYLRGFVLAALGRHDAAWESLSFVPSIMLPQLYWSPLWSGMREHDCFHALIRRLGRTREYAAARTQVVERTLLMSPSTE